MRAVALFVCLALAHQAASNIVRHKLTPNVLSLNVRPVDNQKTDKEWKLHHELDSSSQETKEHYSYDDISDYPSPFRSVKNWNSPLYSVIAQGEIPYGDVIEWRGVQIATGPNSPISDVEEIKRLFDDASKTLQHVSEEDKKRIHEVFQEADQKHEEENLNATQLIKKHGHEAEEHVVKTDDGYHLTLFRIQSKQDIDTNDVNHRPVVLLMHGILGSADDFLLMGPEQSLAYLLHDAGFDVWLGNSRGNKYSRRHASKHVSNPDFWQFSNDEIALHDLPTIIDHVLQTSEQKKLHYIGHSQGSTVFFAMAASLPEYREKVEMMHALSPMVYMTNVRSPLLRLIAPSSHFSELLHEQLTHGEFKPRKEVIREVGGNMCEWYIGCKHVCSNLNFVMMGVDTAGMDIDVIPVVAAHLPAGASVRQMDHYGQGVASHEFRKFDYGSDINKQIYGHHEPPKYNMTEVKVPVALYYSEEDWLSHPKDVERLYRELPDVRDYHKVPEKHFSHMDFQFSKKAPEVVYKRLIESIKNN